MDGRPKTEDQRNRKSNYPILCFCQESFGKKGLICFLKSRPKIGKSTKGGIRHFEIHFGPPQSKSLNK
jgi:hypothetical protein